MQIQRRTIEITERQIAKMFREAERRFSPSVSADLISEFFDHQVAATVPTHTTRYEMAKNIISALHSPEEVRASRL